MKKSAFTLAEVLITLVIIGVIAALTIPTVIKDYNDKKYNTARLKALKTFGEAGKLASINGEINGQENARAFVENVLSKYLKIAKICDNTHPNDCGFPSEIQPSDTTAAKLPVNSSKLVKWNQIGVNKTLISSPTNDANMSTIISTVDGFSAKIFYNPKCGRKSRDIATDKDCLAGKSKECTSYAVDQACMNVIYDMNGMKGPNHAGEDIGFVTTFWSGLNAVSVAPGLIPYEKNGSTLPKTSQNSDVPKVCEDKGTSKTPYTLPNVYELESVVVNKNLTSFTGFNTTTGSRFGSSWWVVDYLGMCFWTGHANKTVDIWCVRR